MADTPMTVDEYVAAQQKEYGTYVATRAIDINGARAFNAGDPVPVSHVEGNIVPRDSVVGANTKTAELARSGEEE